MKETTKRKKRTPEEMKDTALKAQKLLNTMSVTMTAITLKMSRENLIKKYIIPFNLTYRRNRRLTR